MQGLAPGQARFELFPSGRMVAVDGSGATEIGHHESVMQKHALQQPAGSLQHSPNQHCPQAHEVLAILQPLC